MEYRVHGGYSTRSEGGRFDTVTDGNITRHEGEKRHGEARGERRKSGRLSLIPAPS